MVRRMVMLGVVGAVLAAAPASASAAVAPRTKLTSSGVWHTQGKFGRVTSAGKVSGTCTISAASLSLIVTCPKGGTGSLSYKFAAASAVVGKPICSVSHGGTSAVSAKVKASGSAITVRVSVGGHGSAWISLVSVGYYTK
jgi:hypothetical protein